MDADRAMLHADYPVNAPMLESEAHCPEAENSVHEIVKVHAADMDTVAVSSIRQIAGGYSTSHLFNSVRSFLMALSTDQARQFREFGFLAVPEFVSDR